MAPHIQAYLVTVNGLDGQLPIFSDIPQSSRKFEQLRDCSERFTLHPLADLFIPMPSRLLWEHSATLQLLHEECSFRYPPLSVARYSFIQLSELWQEAEDSNPGSLHWEPDVLTATLPRLLLQADNCSL